MKTLTKISSGVLALSLLFINNTFAQSTAFFDNPQGGTAPNVAAQGTLGSNITTLLNYFLGLLGLIAVGFLIYAGILMVTAGGDDAQVTKAKKLITYAVAGIVILSYTIVTFVSSALG